MKRNSNSIYKIKRIFNDVWVNKSLKKIFCIFSKHFDNKIDELVELCMGFRSYIFLKLEVNCFLDIFWILINEIIENAWSIPTGLSWIIFQEFFFS